MRALWQRASEGAVLASCRWFCANSRVKVTGFQGQCWLFLFLQRDSSVVSRHHTCSPRLGISHIACHREREKERKREREKEREETEKERKTCSAVPCTVEMR